eukprot:6857999-Alexandrium_andersonii.AAC.1
MGPNNPKVPTDPRDPTDLRNGPNEPSRPLKWARPNRRILARERTALQAPAVLEEQTARTCLGQRAARATASEARR